MYLFKHMQFYTISRTLHSSPNTDLQNPPHQTGNHWPASFFIHRTYQLEFSAPVTLPHTDSTSVQNKLKTFLFPDSFFVLSSVIAGGGAVTGCMYSCSVYFYNCIQSFILLIVCKYVSLLFFPSPHFFHAPSTVLFKLESDSDMPRYFYDYCYYYYCCCCFCYYYTIITNTTNTSTITIVRYTLSQRGPKTHIFPLFVHVHILLHGRTEDTERKGCPLFDVGRWPSQ